MVTTAEIISGYGWVIHFIIYGTIVAVIGIKLYISNRYPHTFLVKHLVSGKLIKEVDHARKIEKEDGRQEWRLFHNKMNVPVPPSEAVHSTKKGKLFVEGIRTLDSRIIYCGEVMETLEEADKSRETYYNGSALLSNTAFGTEDREFYANHIRRAEERNKKGWWADNGAMMVSITAIVILLVVIFSFWGTIFEPLTQTAGELRTTAMEYRAARDSFNSMRNQSQIFVAPSILNNTG